MDTILVGTPLRVGTVSRPYSFSDGVTIQTIQPILWELSAAKRLMSDDERMRLSAAPYWLCASKEVPNWYSEPPGDDLYEKARRAMYALQIIGPSGGCNQYLAFRKTPEGFDNIGGVHPAKMTSTLMGRMAALDELGFQLDFNSVFQGVNRAFGEGIVRLENPVLLLEHGLQTNHVYLSTLMWVMALDMLYMAGGREPFVERVAGFLGTNESIFPPFLSRKPRLTVGEVLRDLYELRGVIAHGREILKRPFREKFAIVDVSGAKIDEIDYSYAQVLMESSLLLLVKSLRKVMVDGFVDVVKDEGNWKQRLKTCARLEAGS
jgi:hypothetical protein